MTKKRVVHLALGTVFLLVGGAMLYLGYATFTNLPVSNAFTALTHTVGLGAVVTAEVYRRKTQPVV